MQIKSRLCILGVLLFLPLGPAFAQKILVINTFNPTYPWTAYFNLGLRQYAEEKKGAIELYFEELDITRFSDPDKIENFASFLAAKYESVQLDGVIGNSDQACDFIEEKCGFAADLPKAYYTSNLEYAADNVLCLDSQYALGIRETWALMQSVFPEMTEVFLIEGDPATSATVAAELASLVPDTIALTAYKNFTFAELEDRLKALPPTAAVIYTFVTRDSEGTQTIPRVHLSRLAEISPAPIFTLWETLVGSGTVGGHVLSAIRTSRELLRGIEEYLQTGSFSEDYSITRCMIDWTAMDRYGLETGKIPEDAFVINKPDPFYIIHAKLILVVVNIVLIAFFLILLTAILIIIRSYRKLRTVNAELSIEREKAQALALHDPLTNLLNRRAIEPMMQFEMNRKKRANAPVSLLIIDIDHFKRVNDTYGHDVGDIVLKRLAETLTEYRRSTDLVARWGGEEFAVLLSDTEESQAIVLAEKIRKACENLKFEECDGITVSIGVAELIAEETFDSWFKRADAALYTAKKTGRNKTIAASGMDPETAGQETGHELLLLHLVWKDEYSVGVDIYDRQHRELFALSNKLIDAIVNSEGEDTIQAILKELHAHTEEHFIDEQNYLEKRNCSLIGHHKQEHIRLLSRLTGLTQDYAEGKISTYDFILFICNDLISKHILGEDASSFADIRM
ncbi:MAG: diguanylate cyclase [Spirochaetales bacterium]|nr:diguanylate cyclase [Spirochaetales bacterium]